MKTILTIKGMHCNACKVLIEDVCSEIPGVQSCAVSVQEGRAAIEHDDSLSIERLKTEIEGLGDYTIS